MDWNATEKAVYLGLLVNGCIGDLNNKSVEAALISLQAKGFVRWFPRSRAAGGEGAWKPVHWPKRYQEQLDQAKTSRMSLVAPRLVRVEDAELGSSCLIGIRRYEPPEENGCPVCHGPRHSDGTTKAGEMWRCSHCAYRWPKSEGEAQEPEKPVAEMSPKERIALLRKKRNVT